MFEVFKDAEGLWRWTMTIKGESACSSAKGYSKRTGAINEIARVRQVVPDAGIIEQIAELRK